MRVTKRFIFSSGMSLGLVMAGVAFIHPFIALRRVTVTIPGFPPLSYPGFQTWPSPRDFDGPGTVFSLDEGYFEFVSALPVKVHYAGDETWMPAKRVETWKTSILSNFLGKYLDEVSFAESDELEVSVILSGAKRWRADQRDIVAALNSLDLHSPEESIFIVTEAISVSGMEVIVRSSTKTEGSLATSIANQAPSFASQSTGSQNKSLGLNIKYENPHYIFYRAKNIRRLSGLYHETILLTDPLLEKLAWTSERR